MYYKFKRTIKKIIRALLCLWCFTLFFCIVPRETLAASYNGWSLLYDSNGNALSGYMNFGVLSHSYSHSSSYSDFIYFNSDKSGINYSDFDYLSFSLYMVNDNDSDSFTSSAVFNDSTICYAHMSTDNQTFSYDTREGTWGGDYTFRYANSYACTATNSSISSTTYNYDYSIDFVFHLIYSNGYDSSCSVDSSFKNQINIKCPIAFDIPVSGVYIDSFTYHKPLNVSEFTHYFLLSRSYLYTLSDSTIINNSINANTNATNQVNSSVNEVNSSINNSDTSESQNQANSLFSNFNDNDFGLSDIIIMPLNFINSLLSTTCQPLVLPLPYVNKNLILPCMSSIYLQYFGSFYNIYQIITTGFIAYWVCVRIYALVKGFKDPNDDRIEVVDL